jgi:hypothetical protein
MTEYFYRYRPIKSVLDDYHELDGQEIYFSTPGKLNDPMEGFKDLFWLGDEIVWRNFLRHYFLCVLETANYCFIAGDQFDPSVLSNIVFQTPETLPDAPIKEIYQRTCKIFLTEPVVETFVSMVSNRSSPIRRSELTSYLRAIHSFSMQVVIDEYKGRGMFSTRAEDDQLRSRERLRQNAIAMMDGVTKIKSEKHPPERISEALFSSNEATVAQLTLIHEYNLGDLQSQKPFIFWSHRFPAAYVSALDKLVHRDWYVACFAKTAENHSMWSTYADGHRGVCLMFKAKPNANGTPCLTIERITGMGAAKGERTRYFSSGVAHEFQPVRYTGAYPSIDFFRSLGTVSESSLNNFWYSGGNGTFSKCRDDVYADANTWRNEYWKTFSESALYKTPEWSHEEEYRIVVHSGFDMREVDRRKLKYQFCDLAGIVFGARTDIEDKLKIMKIIDQKCAKDRRSDFKFYEIRYLHTESRFQIFPLDLLKIEHA